jgi:hypothetical protein
MSFMAKNVMRLFFAVCLTIKIKCYSTNYVLCQTYNRFKYLGDETVNSPHEYELAK